MLERYIKLEMGNRQPNYNHKIGNNKSECPVCSLQFKSTDTYGHVSEGFYYLLTNILIMTA